MPNSSCPSGAEFELGNVFLSRLPRNLLIGKGNGFFSRAAECNGLVAMFFLNWVLQRMYKSIFTTCSTRMKGPRLCQHWSGGLSERHSFIVRRWPNLNCVCGVGRKNGSVLDYFGALQVLCKDCTGSHLVNRALWRVSPKYLCWDASCPSWLDVHCQNRLIHAMSLCAALYCIQKKWVVKCNLPCWLLFFFTAFSCKAFKASSY